MNVLVVGGGGFIGRHCCKYLCEKGCRVVCLDLNVRNEDGCEIIYRRGDVGDVVQIMESVKYYNIDTVVHLAYMLARESFQYPYNSTKLNILGSNNVFEAARLEKVKRVVISSSVAVFGYDSDYSKPPNEDALKKPATFYGAAKLYNEYTADVYRKLYGLEIVAVRFGVVTGYGRTGGIAGWAGDIVTLPAMGKSIRLPIKPDQGILVTYVKNAGFSLSEIATAGSVRYPVYNCPSEATSARKFADVVEKTIPGADITFNEQGEEIPFVSDWDDSRYRSEFNFPLSRLEDYVVDHIAEVSLHAND